VAFRSNDRVKETSTTTGTGNLTLAGAVSGFQAFSVFANNDTFFYAVVHQTAAEWEVGIGTYVSATPALARTTVLESSNADALVSFSAGTKDVFVDMPAGMDLLMERRTADPAAAEAGWITQFARISGGPQVRTKDEFGLIDVLSERDKQRVRRALRMTVGSDVGSTQTDWFTMGILCTIEGTVAVTSSALDGHSKLLTTAATLDTDAGLNGPYTLFERGTNPDITVKFRVNSTAVRRVWIGFMEADHMASDSTAATHKFAMRLSTSPAVTGFTIVHSNGTTETVEAQIQASDTAIHTIRLIADNANSRFGYSFDGAAIVWITTNIPAATDDLGFQCQIRTLEAVAKNMNMWWMDGTVDT